MKKTLLIICLLAASCSVAHAQQGLIEFLRDLAASQLRAETVDSSSTVTVAGDSLVYKGGISYLDGEWQFKSSAVALNGSNSLKNLAASFAAGSVEKKINEILKQYDILDKDSYFEFHEDNSFEFVYDWAYIMGTWSLDGDKLTMALGRKRTVFAISGKIKRKSDSIEVLFPADKYMKIISFLIRAKGQMDNKSSLTKIADLIDSTDGFEVGFRLKKNNRINN